MLENMGAMNPMSSMPGFEAMRAQQEAFLKAMTGGVWPTSGAGGTGPSRDAPASSQSSEELDDIKAQLADLQNKLSKLDK